MKVTGQDIAYTVLTAYRKIPFTTLVRALGFQGDDELLIILVIRIGLHTIRKRYPQESNGLVQIEALKEIFTNAFAQVSLRLLKAHVACL